MSIEAGGADFTPGAAETLTISGLSTTATTAKFRYSTLEVDGTDQTGGVWEFAFTADDSAFFDPTPNRFDCQIVYNDGTIDPVEMTTGERKIGTVPSAPGSSGQVTSITMGTGMSSSPSPITTTGTINLDASMTDLNDVDSVAPAASGQVLVWNATGGKYEPATPSLSDNSDFSGTSPSDGDYLVYDSTASDWEPTAPDDLAPATGSSVTIVGTAYSPAQDAQVAVKRRTFYHAAESGGTGGGSATLFASGVEFVLACRGWWEAQSSGDRELIEQKWIEFDGSEVTYTRSSHPASAPDGYYLVIDYVETS